MIKFTNLKNIIIFSFAFLFILYFFAFPAQCLTSQEREPVWGMPVDKLDNTIQTQSQLNSSATKEVEKLSDMASGILKENMQTQSHVNNSADKEVEKVWGMPVGEWRKSMGQD